MDLVNGNDDDEDAFEIWPENEHALKCFMLVRRQWRIGPLGGVLGLDYPGVQAVLRMRKIRIDAALLDDLEVMEGGVMVGGAMVGGALDVLNAKSGSA